MNYLPALQQLNKMINVGFLVLGFVLNLLNWM